MSIIVGVPDSEFQSTYLMDVNLQACRNFDNDNLCENFCPPEYIYSPTLYRQVENPDAKYAYGSLCVDKCPCELLIYSYMQAMLFGLVNCSFQTNMYLHVFSVIANACSRAVYAHK